jgi:hypothetical protein
MLRRNAIAARWALLVLSTFSPALASAQSAPTFPNKPIRFLVGFAPGEAPTSWRALSSPRRGTDARSPALQTGLRISLGSSIRRASRESLSLKRCHECLSKASVPPCRKGVKVLELGSLIAGPYASVLLAQFGAEVIKVEPPNEGDPLRKWRKLHDGTSLWWYTQSRNKKSVTLDLKSEEARDIVRRLASDVDIVIENFRPGTLEKWGLGWEQLSALNPELVMVRISGYGQTGPYRERPGTLLLEKCEEQASDCEIIQIRKWKVRIAADTCFGQTHDGDVATRRFTAPPTAAPSPGGRAIGFGQDLPSVAVECCRLLRWLRSACGVARSSVYRFGPELGEARNQRRVFQRLLERGGELVDGRFGRSRWRIQPVPDRKVKARHASFSERRNLGQRGKTRLRRNRVEILFEERLERDAVRLRVAEQHRHIESTCAKNSAM